eukprot:1603498-Rhodomonas_salina.1
MRKRDRGQGTRGRVYVGGYVTRASRGGHRGRVLGSGGSGVSAIPDCGTGNRNSRLWNRG